MTQDEARQLEAAIQARFEAQVETEEVSPGRYRFGVISAQFEGVPHLQRQDQVWQVVDEVLKSESRLDVSIILAYAPSEMHVAP